MKIVLDSCILYPTIMRTVLLGAARRGHFTPIWSRRILEEWARAARKIGPDGEIQARAEIALLQAEWPDATRPPASGLERRLWLPDPGDLHVLALAIASSADAIMTLNAADFPRNILAEEGLTRLDPDDYLMQLFAHDPKGLAAVGQSVLNEANRISGAGWQMRPLLKKARLPRLAKALST